MNNSSKSSIMKLVYLVIPIILIGAILLVVSKQNDKDDKNSNKSGSDISAQADSFSPEFWKRDCKGSGEVPMTHLPMDDANVDFIVPLGALAGPHVTPIDHVYFYPTDMKNRDTSKVYAMADGFIFYYETRNENGDANHSLFIQHNCDVYTYFDLMTSVEPELEKKLIAGKADIHIPVKAGQLLGYVGGRSLDTSVFNLSKPLAGFVNAESYESSHDWTGKQHVDDLFNYFEGENRELLLAKNLRKTEPFGGKVDWDVDGKVIGNWFLEGSKGYAGNSATKAIDNNGQGYWSGHLAIVPDNIDDDVLNISFGSYLGGAAKQFSAGEPFEDPSKIGVSETPTKYSLVEYAQPSKATPFPVSNRMIQGTVLVQLLEKRKLKIETFPGKKPSEVSGFSEQAQIFVR